MATTFWSPAAQRDVPLTSIKRFFSRRWPVALLTSLLVLTGILASGLLKPEYNSEMKILVRRQRLDPIITPQANVTPQVTEGLVTEEDLNSEVEILNSDDLLRKVALTSGLVAHADQAADAKTRQRAVARAIKEMSTRLTIEPIRKTDIIAVHYRATDPQLATTVLEHLASAYLAKHLELERPTGEADFFDAQTKHSRRALEQVQTELRQFGQSHKVILAGTERDFALQRMNTFTASAGDAEEHAAELEHRIQALRLKLTQADPRVLTLQRRSDNPQLQEQLKATLLTLRLKRTELLTKFTEEYPLVQEVEHQIAQTEATIAGETAAPLKDETTDRNPEYAWEHEELTRAETELSGIRAREQSALRLARTSQQQGSKLDELSFEQQALRDQERTDQDNLLLYERKTEEARVSDALDRRGILNVGLAEEPLTPALPMHGGLLFTAIAVILSGVIGLCFAYLVDVGLRRLRFT